MSVTFISGLSPMINSFLDEKHALGYKYEENERYLKKFDALCADRFPEIDTVTKEAGLAWAIANADEGKAGLTRRMSPVRELGRFIIRSGKNAFVIPPECGKVPYRNYIPYIFSDEELGCLFQAADNFRYNELFPENSLEVPVILRLLYACGLRPYEARMILRENIDLDKGTIFIPESKKLKDRIVPMDDAMLSICRKYDEEIRSIIPDSDYFFPCQGRIQHFHNRHWLATVMRRCSLNAEITDGSGAIAPRPYDLRHTFNSGVILINLDYWRKNNIQNKTLNYIFGNKEKCLWHDQDSLNVVLAGSVLFADFRYNLTQGFLFDKTQLKINSDYYNQIDRAIENPCLIHYCASYKPWHFECNSPFKALWRENYKQVFGKKCPLTFKNKGTARIKWCIKFILNTLKIKKYADFRKSIVE